jgi:hypothetical protein
MAPNTSDTGAMAAKDGRQHGRKEQLDMYTFSTEAREIRRADLAETESATGSPKDGQRNPRPMLAATSTVQKVRNRTLMLQKKRWRVDGNDRTSSENG